MNQPLPADPQVAKNAKRETMSPEFRGAIAAEEIADHLQGIRSQLNQITHVLTRIANRPQPR